MHGKEKKKKEKETSIYELVRVIRKWSSGVFMYAKRARTDLHYTFLNH